MPHDYLIYGEQGTKTDMPPDSHIIDKWTLPERTWYRITFGKNAIYLNHQSDGKDFRDVVWSKRVMTNMRQSTILKVFNEYLMLSTAKTEGFQKTEQANF